MSDYHRSYADQADLRIKELEAKIARLTSRGIEDMKFEIDELKSKLSEAIIDLHRALNMGDFYKEERWVDAIREKWNKYFLKG